MKMLQLITAAGHSELHEDGRLVSEVSEQRWRPVTCHALCGLLAILSWMAMDIWQFWPCALLDAHGRDSCICCIWAMKMR